MPSRDTAAASPSLVTAPPKVNRAVNHLSLLFWSPQLVGVAYTLLGADLTTVAVITVYMTVTFAATHYVATHYGGDLLMVLMWLVGISSEVVNAGASADGQHTLPKKYWLLLFAIQGVFSGMLCKAKDVQDERFSPSYSVVERLYLVVPFTVGQWSAYVILNGLEGLVNVFFSIFISLATVGYGALVHRTLARRNVYKIDPVELVTNVLTTSFGVVLSALVAFSLLVVYLAIPFVSVLMNLNAVRSSFGIVTELMFYDLATF